MKKILTLALMVGAALCGGAALAQDIQQAPAQGAPAVAAPQVEAPMFDAQAVARLVTTAELDKIRLLLSGYEYFPTRADLEAVSPNAQQVLIHIAQDKDALPTLRLRAIDALGLFAQGEHAALYFEGTLHQQRGEEIYLRHAMSSSLKAFGQQALPWVQPYLEHQDMQLRLTAIHSIGNLGGQEGIELLRVRHTVEQDSFVRKQMGRFLR